MQKIVVDEKTPAAVVYYLDNLAPLFYRDAPTTVQNSANAKDGWIY
jgi:hypothetical protein